MTTPPSRTFAGSETTSYGIRVQVIVTVPDDLTWKDYRECGEIAQMFATKAMGVVEDSRTRGLEAEKEELKEMPF